MSRSKQQPNLLWFFFCSFFVNKLTQSLMALIKIFLLQGQVTILNQYTISMFYSTPKNGAGDSRPPGDWTCSKVCHFQMPWNLSGSHSFTSENYSFTYITCSVVFTTLKGGITASNVLSLKMVSVHTVYCFAHCNVHTDFEVHNIYFP